MGEDVRGLQIQLSAAMSEATYFKASYARKLEDEKRLLEAASVTVAERDALRAQVGRLAPALGDCMEALAAARRECEGLRTAGDRLLVLWADFTSQETYGEHLRAGMEKRDFDDWDEAHATLRAEMEQ